MKRKCKKCEKPINTMDIGKNGAYYNSKKEIVCFECLNEPIDD